MEKLKLYSKIMLFTVGLLSVNTVQSSHEQFKKTRNNQLAEIKIALNEVSKNTNNDQLAKIIYKQSSMIKIDPKILIAILKVESDFNQSAISSTGDISIAQINYKVWSKEFARLKLQKLNKDLLKKDHVYSIQVMTSILAILKQRHPSDPLWYARYHSSTKKFKAIYSKKMQKNLDIMKKAIALQKNTHKISKPLYAFNNH